MQGKAYERFEGNSGPRFAGKRIPKLGRAGSAEDAFPALGIRGAVGQMEPGLPGRPLRVTSRITLDPARAQILDCNQSRGHGDKKDGIRQRKGNGKGNWRQRFDASLVSFICGSW